ncbi:MAG: ATP-binding protein, partial [Spirochaetota bacterium]
YQRVRVSRARANYWFPARIQLALATNRCPCGMLGRDDRRCLCSLSDVDRYWRRLGGPLLDRIDLRIQVSPRPLEGLPETEGSSTLAARVSAAVAWRRSSRRQTSRNSELRAVDAGRACALTLSARRTFASATRAFGMSTRASLSVLRVARTIADLARVENVGEEHLLEAISYRRYGEQRPFWEPEPAA